MLNRWIENGLLETLGAEGIGCIVFSPLAQGLLTSKYLTGVPEESRAANKASAFRESFLSAETLAKIRALNAIAERRGQTLAQMAIAWALRDPRVTSALIGASSAAQIENSIEALGKPDFTADELAEIDRYATESAVNLWTASSAVV
jgi:L-glyceraldehyde 3-phosphate reductase